MPDAPSTSSRPLCAECGRPAIVAYDQGDGRYLSFCLTHAQQYQEINFRTIEALQEQRDRLEDEISDTVGLPRQARPLRIPAPRVHVHQVNIEGNNLGVVNTGTIGNITNNLTVISGQDAALAANLKELTEAILASTTLETARKQEAADLLREVVEDVAKPPQQRRSRVVMKTIGAGLGVVLSHAADLATLWTAIEPHLHF